MYFQSTYCSNLVKHCTDVKRTVHVVNLDPAAEQFNYPVSAGKGSLIHLLEIVNLIYYQIYES